MLETGYIKLYRAITKWEWYDNINTCRLFLHLLLTVEITPRKWKGIELERGERAVSLHRLATESSLSIKEVRTALNHLKAAQAVAQRETPVCSVFSVLNFEHYQSGAQVEANGGHVEGTRGAHEGHSNKESKNTRKQEGVTCACAREAPPAGGEGLDALPTLAELERQEMLRRKGLA